MISVLDLVFLLSEYFYTLLHFGKVLQFQYFLFVCPVVLVVVRGSLSEPPIRVILLTAARLLEPVHGFVFLLANFGLGLFSLIKSLQEIGEGLCISLIVLWM